MSLGQVMLSILERVEDRLTEPVGIAEVSPGLEVVWDDCCGGQLWVRLMAQVPYLDQQGQNGANTRYAILGWTTTISVGTVRCITSIDAQTNEPPTPDQITADALVMVRDMEEIRDALFCGLDGIPNLARPVIQNWTPLGPIGGCAGGEWSFQFLLPYCACVQ